MFAAVEYMYDCDTAQQYCRNSTKCDPTRLVVTAQDATVRIRHSDTPITVMISNSSEERTSPLVSADRPSHCAFARKTTTARKASTR